MLMLSMKNTFVVWAGLAVLLGFARPASAATGPNLIRNGSFELYTGPGVVPLYWANTVVPSQILFAADGIWAVALTGFVSGPTSQSVATVPGVTYDLRFAARAPVFGSNEFEGTATRQPDGTWVPDGPWIVNASANGFSLGSFENDNTNAWQYFTTSFVAASTTTLIAFSPGAAGCPLLDDVSLYAVPEPSVCALLATAAMLPALRRRAARS